MLTKKALTTAVLFSILPEYARAKSSTTEHDKTRFLLKPEIEQFDKKCALSPMAQDAAVFDYIDQRVSPESYPRHWSPKKIMDTIIDLSSPPSWAEASDDALAAWILLKGLKDGQRLRLSVGYNTDESKDTGFFKERRNCSDRLAAQASADFAFFVKSYTKTNLALSYQGSLTITHGTWSSDVETRIQNRDRELYRELYDYYKKNPKKNRLAVISRIRALTALGTTDRAASARLEAGLSASGGISFAKGDLSIEAAASLGQEIQLQTITTLVGTMRGGWIAINERSYPKPDITIVPLPTRADVERRLTEDVYAGRDTEWTAQAGAKLLLPVRIHGITAHECENIKMLELEGTGESAVRKPRSVSGRGYAAGDCTATVEVDSLLSTGQKQKQFSVRYGDLELVAFNDTVFIGALIHGKVVVEGRDAATQLARWEVEFLGSKDEFTVQPWTDSLTFACPGDLRETTTLTATPDPKTKRVVLFTSKVLATDCRATPPSLKIVPKGGSAADAPILGALIVR